MVENGRIMVCEPQMSGLCRETSRETWIFSGRHWYPPGTAFNDSCFLGGKGSNWIHCSNFGSNPIATGEQHSTVNQTSYVVLILLLLLLRFYSYSKYNISTKCTRIYIWSRTHDSIRKSTMRRNEVHRNKNIIARDKRKTMKQQNDLTHASHCQPAHMDLKSATYVASVRRSWDTTLFHELPLLKAIFDLPLILM